MESSAELRPVLEGKYAKIKKLEDRMNLRLKNNEICDNSTLLEELTQLMNEHVENFTVRSIDYKTIANYMSTILYKTYGIFIEHL